MEIGRTTMTDTKHDDGGPAMNEAGFINEF